MSIMVPRGTALGGIGTGIGRVRDIGPPNADLGASSEPSLQSSGSRAPSTMPGSKSYPEVLALELLQLQQRLAAEHEHSIRTLQARIDDLKYENATLARRRSRVKDGKDLPGIQEDSPVRLSVQPLSASKSGSNMLCIPSSQSLGPATQISGTVAKVEKPTKCAHINEEADEEAEDDEEAYTESEEDESFQVADCWSKDTIATTYRRKSHFRTMQQNMERDSDGSRRTSVASSASRASNKSLLEQLRRPRRRRCRMPKFEDIAMDPYSKPRLVWELASFFLIMLDVITFPMAVFYESGEEAIPAFVWTSRIYWMLDIGAQFFFGYVDEEGATVMHPRRIARRYLLRQFHIDLFVVLTDWGEYILGTRATGMLKSGRILRIFRILRIRKFREIGMKIQDYFRSEKVLVLVSLGKMLSILLIVSHLIACAWFGLLPAGATVEDGLTDQYMRSFHFAISIFFGEHVELPSNTVQRFFVVACLLVTFMLQIWFVSFITTAMTHLEIISSKRASQFASLRNFFDINNVPESIALKVEKNAKRAIKEQERNVPEHCIELLSIISKPLMMDLHYEVHNKVFRWHPFFKCYAEVNLACMKQVCHYAVSVYSVQPDDVIFLDLETPRTPQMLFLQSGSLVYSKPGSERSTLVPGFWLSEATLWTDEWVHCGTLRAVEDSRLIAINAAAFQEVVGSHPSQHAHDYAEAFVEMLNKISAGELTDIGEYTPMLGDVMDLSFSDVHSWVRSDFEKASAASQGTRRSDYKRFSNIGAAEYNTSGDPDLIFEGSSGDGGSPKKRDSNDSGEHKSPRDSVVREKSKKRRNKSGTIMQASIAPAPGSSVEEVRPRNNSTFSAQSEGSNNTTFQLLASTPTSSRSVPKDGAWPEEIQ
eukprot:TRINITY_DN9212_c0_g1_i1.p1 TRINITY_DN9212_c0_g1~~TRINITY_DN9212_c0_g1_i1.p1  ORF type:complete len:879 (-),score=179.15 TRINITY_DN9212_c0_g1_i1:123-2759(-)